MRVEQGTVDELSRGDDDGGALNVVETGDLLALARGSVAVCIPVYGAFDYFTQCLWSVLKHTPPHVPILVADDASPDPAIRSHLVRLAAEGDHAGRLHYLRQPVNSGFVGNVNAGFTALAPADVIVLNSDCVVGEGWLERLRAAAYSDTRVATASTLTNNGSILSVPERNHPTPSLPQDWSVDQATRTIAAKSLNVRPEIPTAVGHCFYVRRTALDLVGGFDPDFSPGYGEEVDFSQRCIAAGLSHVLADDVFVLHYGSASFTAGGVESTLPAAHHEIIKARYPYYDSWVQDVAADTNGPLSRSLSSARRALQGFSVTIDGRILTPFVTGSQVHTLEVVGALDALGGLRVRVVVPEDLGDYAAELMSRMPNVDLLAARDVGPDTQKTDVVHRPYQLSGPADMQVLRNLAPRLVVTQQDFIAYHNPAYFPGFDSWERQRRLTRAALSAADQVVFFSRHAAGQALAADLVDRDRVNVVYIGTDHRLAELRPEPAPPRGADAIEGRRFLLCLGTDFHHKNRVFALRLLQELRERHAWDGTLVFAGPHAAHGSSAGAEAAFLAARPALAEAVVDLLAVDEPGKRWLMQNAEAMVYPTTFEGFGLVPFEAADEGLPCLFAPETALAETLPRSTARLIPWDPVESAVQVAELLDDPAAQETLVRSIQAAGAPFTWARTARGLAGVYLRAAAEPVRDVARLAGDRVSLERERANREAVLLEAEAQLRRFQELFGEVKQYEHLDGALVRSDGIPAAMRRPLLAIAHRRVLRALVFGPVTLIYRLVYFVRHGRRRGSDLAPQA